MGEKVFLDVGLRHAKSNTKDRRLNDGGGWTTASGKGDAKNGNGLNLSLGMDITHELNLINQQPNDDIMHLLQL
jgi:hypothetical protein